MTVDVEQCEGALYHAPAPLWTQRHHVYPKFLCALFGIGEIDIVVPLCGNCHGRVHHVLTHLINTGESPHRLSAAEATWVRLAWEWYQRMVTR